MGQDRQAEGRGAIRPSLSRIQRLPELFTSPLYRRALWCRTVCRMLARINPDVRYLGLVRGDDLTFLLLRDSVITPYSLVGEGFQREELLRVIQWCATTERSLGGVFVDVGANMGTTTLMAMGSGSFTRAICIEPGPENVRLIRLNLEANGIQNRAGVVAAAASRGPSIAQLYLAGDNSGDHQLGSAPGGPKNSRSSIEVEVNTLDHIIASVGVEPGQVSCVWVDTQGSEGFVLEGAADLIASGAPFCIEFWPHGCRRIGSYNALLQILENEFDGFVDLAEPHPGTVRRASTIRSFARRFDDSTDHTDLFLIPHRR